MADRAQHHRSRAAGEARHAMMLGNPEPPVAQRFGGLRQRDGFRQRLADRAAFADRDQIED